MTANFLVATLQALLASSAKSRKQMQKIPEVSEHEDNEPNRTLWAYNSSASQIQVMLNPVHYIDESKAKQLWTRPEIAPMIASATRGSGKGYYYLEEGAEGISIGPS